MAQGKNQILDYRAHVAFNREVFLLRYEHPFRTFCSIDGNFGILLQLVQSQRDPAGNSHISLAPFLMLMQRQSRSAFEALASDQSYQAWVLIRPAVEAALIIGKWVDDPKQRKDLGESKGARKALSEDILGEGNSIAELASLR